MTKSFLPWKVDEVWLLPPSVQEFVPDGHPAHLVRDIVAEELDLSAILAAYTEPRGYPPYHPAMMVALLLYAYSRGVYSSRRIARACEERLDFQAATALNRPDSAPSVSSAAAISPRWLRSLCRCSPCAGARAWSGSAMSRWTAPGCGLTPSSTRP
jgi:hypothetical protein